MTTDSKFSNMQSIIEDKMLMLMEDVSWLHEGGLSWIESIIQYCEDASIEVEDVIPMLPPMLLTKLHDEGISFKTIKGDKYPKLL